MAKIEFLDIISKDYKSKVLELLQRKPVLHQINKLAGGAKYVPVSVVEEQLNWLFPMCWSHEITNFQVVMNEIVMTSILTIDVPGQFSFKRAGASSLMIQQKADAPILDASSKIKNALEKGFPKGKAECLKNAAKSLGNLFGANLNRKLEFADEKGQLQKYDYQNQILVDDSKLLLLAGQATSKEDLKNIWNQLSMATRASDEIGANFAMLGEKFKQLG